MGPDDQTLPPAPPAGLPPPGQPSGISGFTGALGAGGPAVPFVPPASIIGAGPQQGAPPPPVGPLGTPSTALSQQGLVNQQIAGLDARKAITAGEAENIAAGSAAAGDINAGAADKLAEQQAQQKAAWEHAQASVDARTEALRSNVAAAQAQEVDPNRLWKSKSTGAKVLAGLGVALGAAGASLGHGQNTAMTIFQDAIDKDIDSQKTNIANSWKGVQEKHGLDNDDATRALHDQTWRQNFQTAGLENIKLQLASAAAKTSSTSVKANAANAIQDINDKQGVIRNGLYASQMAAQAGAGAKAEKLAGEARAMFSKLVEKEGTDPAAAQKVVDSQFPQLQGTAYASAGQRQTAANDLQAQNLARQTVLQSNGQITLGEALKKAREQVEKTSPAYGATGNGPLVVPKEQRDAQTSHNARMEELASFDPKIINPSITTEGIGHSRYEILGQQERYKQFVREQVLKNWHDSTGASRPPPPEQLEDMVKPYLPSGALESVDHTATRIEHLKHASELAAKSKGLRTAVDGKPAAPAAAVPGGALPGEVDAGQPILPASPPPTAPAESASSSRSSS